MNRKGRGFAVDGLSKVYPPMVELHHRRPDLHTPLDWYTRPALHDVMVTGLLWGV